MEDTLRSSNPNGKIICEIPKRTVKSRLFPLSPATRKQEKFGFSPMRQISSKTPYRDSPKVTDHVNYTDYRFESKRLHSFSDWLVPFMEPKKLAKAGFFYNKKYNGAQCFACSLTLYSCPKVDDPMLRHRRWSGNCAFVRNLPCGNVPIGADPTTIPKIPKRKGVCGIKYIPCSGPDNDLQKKVTTSLPVPPVENNIEMKKMYTAKFNDVLSPKIPTYASYERRLASFATWPKAAWFQAKEDMAAAGFFFYDDLFDTHFDKTMCFYCEGILKEWLPSDDPVEEHARWLPRCEFIKKLIAEKDLQKQLKEEVDSYSCPESTDDETDEEVARLFPECKSAKKMIAEKDLEKQQKEEVESYSCLEQTDDETDEEVARLFPECKSAKKMIAEKDLEKQLEEEDDSYSSCPESTDDEFDEELTRMFLVCMSKRIKADKDFEKQLKEEGDLYSSFSELMDDETLEELAMLLPKSEFVKRIIAKKNLKKQLTEEDDSNFSSSESIDDETQSDTTSDC